MNARPGTTFDRTDRRRPRTGRAGVGGLVVALRAAAAGIGLALLFAAGCETGGVLPVNPGSGGNPPAPQQNAGGGQNTPPVFRITWPSTNLTIQDGAPILIQFEARDAEDNVRVNLQVDPDTFPTNGNEIVLASGLVVTPSNPAGAFEWNTTSFPAATYFVRGTADDGVNAVVSATAAGTVKILPRPGDPPGGDGGDPPPPPNEVPQLFVSAPSQDLSIDAGTLVRVEYTRIDRDSTTTLFFEADPDFSDDNDNEILIFGPVHFPAGTGVSEFFTWDTTGFAPGEYRVVGTIDDNVAEPGRPVRSVAPAIVKILGSGTGVPTQKPVVQLHTRIVNGTFLPAIPGIEAGTLVTVPTTDRGVRHGDEVEVPMVLRNLEREENLTVQLFLDLDRISDNNDIDFPDGDSPDPNRQQPLIPVGSFVVQGSSYNSNIFFEPLPSLDEIRPGVFQLVPFRFMIDTTIIPVRNGPDERDELGRPLPYQLRVVVDDGHTDAFGNRDHRVNAYADKGIYVQAMAEGVVDLRDAGSAISGAIFQGFAPFDYLGTEFLAAGDIFFEPDVVLPSDDPDVDPLPIPADEFALVARYGSPRNRRNVGAAYVIFGRPNTASRGRFAGINNIASVGAQFAGSVIAGNIPTYKARFDGEVLPPGFPPPSPPPEPLREERHPNVNWSGITSLSLIQDVTGGDDGLPADGLPDFVVGVPFISGLYDAYDDDPCDCDPICTGTGGNPDSFYSDFPSSQGQPFSDPETGDVADDLGFINFADGTPIDQGYVFVVAGDSVEANRFNDLRWTGQFGEVNPGFRGDDEGNGIGGFTPIPEGMRFRGGNFRVDPLDDPPLASANEFGHTVAVSPSLSGQDTFQDVLVSAPGATNERGFIRVMFGFDWLSIALESGADEDANHSLPTILNTAIDCDCERINPDDDTDTRCNFGVRNTTGPGSPTGVFIFGAVEGDRLGYAGPAGDFNGDGANDILCGAPGADLAGLVNNGVVYILFGNSVGFGNINMQTDIDYPGIELRGTHGDIGGVGGDRFGEVQKLVGDIDGDNVEDLAFAARRFDDDVSVPGENAVDAGFVGILYGNIRSEGRRAFSVLQVGTPELPGIKFFGATAGAMAGASISGAGDFNRDGYDDLLIAAPGETRLVPVELPAGGGTVNQLRKGVAYLVFGGPHLRNQSFNLSQVGSPELPGIVFISPYEEGTNSEAPTETVGRLGDVDGDGFDDIAIGAPKADFVFPTFPDDQRRESAGEVYIIYGSNFGRNQLP